MLNVSFIDSIVSMFPVCRVNVYYTQLYKSDIFPVPCDDTNLVSQSIALKATLFTTISVNFAFSYRITSRDRVVVDISPVVVIVSKMANTSSIDCVQVNLLTFATVRDRLESSGCKSNTNEPNKFHISLNSSWPNARELRLFICGQLWPCLADIEPSIALALNLNYLDLDGPVNLTSQDDLALIPPISGG